MNVNAKNFNLVVRASFSFYMFADVINYFQLTSHCFRNNSKKNASHKLFRLIFGYHHLMVIKYIERKIIDGKFMRRQ
jgi:hypothetical protein